MKMTTAAVVGLQLYTIEYKKLQHMRVAQKAA